MKPVGWLAVPPHLQVERRMEIQRVDIDWPQRLRMGDDWNRRAASRPLRLRGNTQDRHGFSADRRLMATRRIRAGTRGPLNQVPQF